MTSLPYSDAPPPPPARPGMSRVDGCGMCVYNVEAPWASIDHPDGGYTNLYTCSDCGHRWQTAWGS